MKSKFSEIVSKYLFSYGSVSVPGIGTFSISDSSSGFILENDILTPPTKMIDFSESVSDEDGLVKYLKNNHGYSRKDAEKKISDYSKKFLNDLLNYGVANIPGIGQLSKYANGEIVFDPAKEYLITSNYMLPELKLYPLGSSPAATKEEVTPAPKAAADKLKAAAVPTAATTAAFLGAQSEPTPAPTQVTPPVPEVKQPAPVVETPKPKPVAEVAKPIAPAEVKKPTPVAPLKEEVKPLVKKEPVVSEPITRTPEPIRYDDEPGFWSEWKWIILSLLGLIALSIFGVKCFSKYFTGESGIVAETIETAKNTLTGKSTDTKEVDLEEYLKDKPKLQKYAKYLTMDIIEDGCIVIVGTYKKNTNMLRMKNRIQSAGLDPYTEMHNGMTRVGVRFQCNDQDLVEYIGSIRKSFDRGAWYLNPRMDVPR